MKKLHEHSKLLDAMGGVRQVAKDYKLNINTVQAWKMRGIPSKFQLFYPQFMRRARKLANVKVTGRPTK
jgi:hypothetical protein